MHAQLTARLPVEQKTRAGCHCLFSQTFCLPICADQEMLSGSLLILPDMPCTLPRTCRCTSRLAMCCPATLMIGKVPATYSEGAGGMSPSPHITHPCKHTETARPSSPTHRSMDVQAAHIYLGLTQGCAISVLHKRQTQLPHISEISHQVLRGQENSRC